MALILGIASCAGATTRPAAVAGGFYPADADRLRGEVASLVAAVAGPQPSSTPRALVVPHAGYAYSGRTAAKAFALLRGAEVRRVILLGPTHHVRFSGGALPAGRVTSFTTPLGEVPLDVEAVAALRADRDFRGPAEAHDPEHCLEVELPFLQVVAPDASIVPVLIGSDTDREQCGRIARALAELLDPGTVVVVSSDFTHYGRQYGYTPFAGSSDVGERLLRLGRATAGRLAALDADGFAYQVEVSGDTVCGRRPLEVLGALLEGAFSGRGEVVGITASGQLTGDWNLSVTYAAVGFEGAWHAWSPPAPPSALEELSTQDATGLLGLARAVLRTHLTHDGSVAEFFAGHHISRRAHAPAGAFVTLHNQGARALREGRLRACMGIIEARQSAMDAVVQAAISAAHDPRFPPLEAAELDQVELEISLLSAPRRVSGPEAIRVGEHGVVLTKGVRRAVFLPQVATEQGWDRDTMLDHLARKAGLPAGAWRRGADFEVFTAQVFAEGS